MTVRKLRQLLKGYDNDALVYIHVQHGTGSYHRWLGIKDVEELIRPQDAPGSKAVVGILSSSAL